MFSAVRSKEVKDIGQEAAFFGTQEGSLVWLFHAECHTYHSNSHPWSQTESQNVWDQDNASSVIYRKWIHQNVHILLMRIFKTCHTIFILIPDWHKTTFVSLSDFGCGKSGSQVVEWLGNGASNPKVGCSIPGHAIMTLCPWARHFTLLASGGMSLYLL